MSRRARRRDTPDLARRTRSRCGWAACYDAPDRSRTPRANESARAPVASDLEPRRPATSGSPLSQTHQPRLTILERTGAVVADLPVGPNGIVESAQWTPDGRFVFLPAEPEAGRRILAVEAESARVFDLSQPGWDAAFSLSPDGRELLLTNGRGGFWLAPMERPGEPPTQ